MKFNWGTGIVIALGLFISYILFMVFTMMSAHTDVVEEDYYAQQIGYQETKEAKENGLEIVDSMSFQQMSESVDIIFPETINVNEIVSGNVHFYRAENASLDRKFELNPALGNIQKTPLKHLEKGSYIIKLWWETSSRKYLVEKKITID